MVERPPASINLSLSDINSSYHLVSMLFMDSHIVNKQSAHAVWFVFTILTILVFALLVNTLSIVLIMKRESTLVNTLLTMHCTANALLSVLSSIAQYKSVGNELFCAPVTVLYSRCFVDYVLLGDSTLLLELVYFHLMRMLQDCLTFNVCLLQLFYKIEGSKCLWYFWWPSEKVCW